jgi:hypothetical protein
MKSNTPVLMKTLFFFLSALLVTVIACQSDDPATGESDAGTGGRTATGGTASGGTASGGAGASPLANFAAVREIVSNTCGGAGCHQTGDTPPALLVDDAKLLSTLTTFVSKQCGNRVLVKKGAPKESAFYLAQAGECGKDLARMPLGCVDRCIPKDYLDGVWQWIENGAPGP